MASLAPSAVASVRAALFEEGAVRVDGLSGGDLVAAIDAWLDVDDFEEAWSACPAGAEAVARTRALLEAMFGFVLLDPFRVERTPGQVGLTPQADARARWHRDNWPVTRDHGSERRFFYCRPVLLLSDLDDPGLGPTEYRPGTHRRARWADPIEEDRPPGVPMLGATGDLWLMASRVVHRRAFSPGGAPPHPGVRKIAWMIAKTETPHP